MQPTFPHIRFWGTRGSRPQADEKYGQFGKETTCVEVELPQQILVFDAGTGFYDFSDNYLKRSPEQKKPIAVFIGHMHFDHLLGAEQAGIMFNGAIKKTFFGSYLQWNELGEAVKAGSFEDAYKILFSDPFSPDMAEKHLGQGKVILKDLTDRIRQTMKLPDGYSVQFLPLHHGTKMAIGAKLQHGKDSYCILTDLSLQDTPEDGLGQIERFCRHASIVIADGMFTRNDFTKMPFLKGFGHSAAEDVIDLCAVAGVQRALISHHPMASDTDLATRESFLQNYAAQQGYRVNVALARTGNYDIPPQLKKEPGLVPV